jgi:hypothetical protein
MEPDIGSANLCLPARRERRAVSAGRGSGAGERRCSAPGRWSGRGGGTGRCGSTASLRFQKWIFVGQLSGISGGALEALAWALVRLCVVSRSTDRYRVPVREGGRLGGADGQSSGNEGWVPAGGPRCGGRSGRVPHPATLPLEFRPGGLPSDRRDPQALEGRIARSTAGVTGIGGGVDCVPLGTSTEPLPVGSPSTGLAFSSHRPALACHCYDRRLDLADMED